LVEETHNDTESPRDRSPWFRLVLSVLGLAIAVYLTIVHYDHHVALVCPLHGGIINCADVVTSASSVILGVPIALWGVLWFIIAGALAIWPLVSASARLGSIRIYTLTWSVVGIIGVLYFLYLELHVDDHICIWCTTAHVLVLAYLASAALSPPPAETAP